MQGARSLYGGTVSKPAGVNGPRNLRVRPISHEGRGSDEDHDGCDVEEGFSRSDGRFDVLPKAAVAADPGEEAFDHPPVR